MSGLFEISGSDLENILDENILNNIENFLYDNLVTNARYHLACGGGTRTFTGDRGYNLYVIGSGGGGGGGLGGTNSIYNNNTRPIRNGGGGGGGSGHIETANLTLSRFGRSQRIRLTINLGSGGRGANNQRPATRGRNTTVTRENNTVLTAIGGRSGSNALSNSNNGGDGGRGGHGGGGGGGGLSFYQGTAVDMGIGGVGGSSQLGYSNGMDGGSANIRGFDHAGDGGDGADNPGSGGYASNMVDRQLDLLASGADGGGGGGGGKYGGLGGQNLMLYGNEFNESIDDLLAQHGKLGGGGGGGSPRIDSYRDVNGMTSNRGGDGGDGFVVIIEYR
jgi:hypothetical protein